jgi:hypothetical protein
LRTERCARRIPSRPVLTTLGVPGVTTVAKGTATVEALQSVAEKKLGHATVA